MKSRIIKFKCWDTNRECWVTENALFLNGMEKPVIELEKKFSGINICQWTGLLDKNGKEIYEGDIVHCDDMVKRIVVYEGCGFELQKPGTNAYAFDYWEGGVTEIIGNIYENKDLLN